MNDIKHQLVNIQWGIFFSPLLQVQQPKELADVLLKKFKNLFNGPPTILPIPEAAPVEIPSAILKSTNGQWQLNLSRMRLDIIYSENNIEDYKLMEKTQDEMIKILNNVVKKINADDIKINRLTNIVNYSIHAKNPTLYLKNAFNIKEIPNLKEINLRINQNEKVKSFELNNITLIQTGIDLINNKKIILLQKDVNTVPYTKNNFQMNKIKEFFEECKTFLNWDGIDTIIN